MSHASATGPLPWTVEDLACALGASRAQVFRLHSRGLLPRPLPLGRSLRWDRTAFVRWLAAGAPPRGRWEQQCK
jgi:predicted DNA-binding transcriptional regulator AlpA